MFFTRPLEDDGEENMLYIQGMICPVCCSLTAAAVGCAEKPVGIFGYIVALAILLLIFYWAQSIHARTVLTLPLYICCICVMPDGHKTLSSESQAKESIGTQTEVEWTVIFLQFICLACHSLAVFLPISVVFFIKYTLHIETLFERRWPADSSNVQRRSSASGQSVAF